MKVRTGDEILEGIKKMTQIIKAVHNMEQFIKGVCDVVFQIKGHENRNLEVTCCIEVM